MLQQSNNLSSNEYMQIANYHLLALDNSTHNACCPNFLNTLLVENPDLALNKLMSHTHLEIHYVQLLASYLCTSNIGSEELIKTHPSEVLKDDITWFT